MRRCPGLICLGFHLLVVVAGGATVRGVDPIAAQAPRVEFDVTASRIKYDTLSALNAPSMTALTEWRRPSLFGRVGASLTSFQNAGWSAQGRASLAGWLSPLGREAHFRVEVGGSAVGSSHSRGFDTGSGRLDGRVHWLGGGWGTWLGASLSASKNSLDPSSVDAWVPNGGAWFQTRSVRGVFTYLHTSVSGEAYPEANLALTLSRGALDLSLYGGAREWPSDPGAVDEWWSGATAAFWVTANLATVVSGGTYGADILRGLSGGEFLSVGLRITPRRVRPIPIAAAVPIVYTIEQARTGAIGFDVGGARSVEIAGDWNGWQTASLRPGGGSRWLLPTRLEPGTYRFNLLVDGERWMVPDGVPTIGDGFGGSVGLLVVTEPN